MTRARIPTNLVTGFLGVGKTTAILDLLRARPAGSRWAVIVNEYGEVGIDGAFLADVGGVEVQEVAGGCLCCTSAAEFNFTLAQVIEHIGPERILIETTGVGHPARILEDLRGPAFAKDIDVRATLAILAPADFTCPPMFESPVFRDQIELADVLVLNKGDEAGPEVRSRFLDWSASLFPPKLHAAVTERGRLEAAWLDLGSDGSRQAVFPHAHDRPSPSVVRLERATPGRPVRSESVGLVRACGWIFHPADVFDEARLLQALHHLRGVTRLKGVFHTEADWIAVNRVGKEMTTWATNYRRDSRVEAFAGEEADWEAVEQRLRACLVQRSATA